MTVFEFQTAVEEILNVQRGSIKESDSRDSIASWSSLADVKIVALLSSESGIELDAELMEAETFGEMLKLLKQIGALQA
jgi:acyl carrier protein